MQLSLYAFMLLGQVLPSHVCLCSLSGEAAALHQQTDVRSVHVYENQRWNPMTGYTDK